MMCAEAVGANGKLFAEGAVVNWAWTGQLSYPNVCTQGLLEDIGGGPALLVSYIVVLNLKIQEF